ncbi:putative membrane protein [Halanaeroarchaeum sp. HSR-CO]|uniref:hypothetical protein n=1 Tax=Halanaeroarchaeum sp. HSR-CO TaxID=2866382 RepID=UPI00217EA555|nr:hypothetical protein [Halanaeroarchaeum sp. HSR-CO]UWG48003.1 putative membrane protein [Halanaeroarchaeum sp. HSR-CO]
MSGTDDPAALVDVPDLDDIIDRLFRNSRTNAMIAWLLVAVLLSVFLESLVGFDIQWLVFVGFVGFVVLLPPIAYREWRVMLPWELLVLALLPIIVRAVFGGTLGTFATYLSLAGLALIVIVELHMFTSLKVTPWFAVALVTMTTLATVAAWTIFRWNADKFLGTTYLVDNETLMMEWIYVTLAGLVAGILFETYFSRRDRTLWQRLRRVVRR